MEHSDFVRHMQFEKKRQNTREMGHGERSSFVTRAIVRAAAAIGSAM